MLLEIYECGDRLIASGDLETQKISSFLGSLKTEISAEISFTEENRNFILPDQTGMSSTNFSRTMTDHPFLPLVFSLMNGRK